MADAICMFQVVSVKSLGGPRYSIEGRVCQGVVPPGARFAVEFQQRRFQDSNGYPNVSLERPRTVGLVVESVLTYSEDGAAQEGEAILNCLASTTIFNKIKLNDQCE